MNRRQFAMGAGASLLLPACTKAERPKKDWVSTRLAAIETAAGGRLGVSMWSANRAQAGWRQGERFALCSTFKLSLAALALHEIQAGRARTDETLAYSRSDLLPNSPETEKHLGEGRMTIAALAEAAQRYSDNCAANLLLRRFGGPAGLTRFWRQIGDRETRLDRFETELNRVPPGDLRDTTTPQAMAAGIGRLLTPGRSILSPESRSWLLDRMRLTETGAKRIRAALPPGWTGGDKTGTGNAPGLTTKINDVAILSPPGATLPVIVAAYYETAGPTATIRPEDEAVLKQVGEVVVAWVASWAR